MVSIDFENAFSVGKNGLNKAEFLKSGEKLTNFLAAVLSRDQGFYSAIDDEKVVKKITRFVRSVRNRYESIVVLGIGGSALGTLCLAQSLGHLYANELRKRKQPKLYVLDNIDPVLMAEVGDVINIKETLFIVITKSGGTPETLSQYFYFRRLTDKQRISPAQAFVFVTDPKAGLLHSLASKEGIPVFDVPPNVGGRFSVLTAVGLLPAALIGINIQKLLQGARAMRDKFLSKKFDENLPFQLAATQYLMATSGKTIQVLMPYAQKLIRFADWFRQLLAESIGKAVNRAGRQANVGITPVNALGVTDQHSQSQLYNEGPFDKLIIFIIVKNLGKKLPIPALYPQAESTAFLRGVSFNELIAVEQVATAQSLTQQGRPNICVKIDVVDEAHLGGLFMLLEGATAFLGEWYNIDAFNQPGVELSKVLTKQLLSKKLSF